MWKKIVKYPLAFIVGFAVCVSLLLVVTQIPQSAIYDNSKVSAEYFKNSEAFPIITGNMLNSRADNYADTELMNVIYNTEGTIKGIIVNPYYRVEGHNANEDFMTSVNGGEANNEYGRYWHGSQVLIRPLLTVTSIKGVRGCLFGLLIIMNIELAALLWQKKYYRPLIVYIVSLVAVQVWMTAFSLEYIMTFLITTAVSIAVILISNKGQRDDGLICLFIVAGLVTSFMDFLTAETLTFTVPYILMLMINKEQKKAGNFKEEFIRLFKLGCCWLISYVLMFAVKWLLVYMVLGAEGFNGVMDNALLRIDGTVTADGTVHGAVLSSGQRTVMALIRNLACLFPVGENTGSGLVLVLTLGILLVSAACFYMLRKEKADGVFIGIILFICVLPYVRFIVLSSHSYIHYFFTYRAQMATVMGILSLFAYELEPSYIGLSNKKNKHTGKPKKH